MTGRRAKRQRSVQKKKKVLPASCWQTACVMQVYRHTHASEILTVRACVRLVCVCTSPSLSSSPPSSMRSASERPDLAAVALGAACQPLPPRPCHVTPCTKQLVPPTSFRAPSLPPKTSIDVEIKHRRKKKPRQQCGCNTAQRNSEQTEAASSPPPQPLQHRT